MKPKQGTKHEADKLVRDFAFLLQNQSGRQAVSAWVYQDAGERIDVSSRIWFGRDLREAKKYMPMRPRGGARWRWGCKCTPNSLPVLVPVLNLSQSHFVTTKTPD